MKLHAPERQRAMRQAHDLALSRPGRHGQALRQALAGHDQRVIAGGGEWIGQAAEERAIGFLYEDDGCSQAFAGGACARTRFEIDASHGAQGLASTRTGSFEPPARARELVLHGARGLS